MGQLAERIELDLGNGNAVPVVPTLRAALRLARDYQTLGAVLDGVKNGSVTVMSRVFGECGVTPAALPDLFTQPGSSIASLLRARQLTAYRLVFQMLGVDPDAASGDDENHPAAATPADRVSDVERFETMFGFATGILKYTPADAWNSTPAEIAAAAAFRRKAFAPKDDPKATRPHHELTLDQQAELFAAQLQARYGGASHAA